MLHAARGSGVLRAARIGGFFVSSDLETVQLTLKLHHPMTRKEVTRPVSSRVLKTCNFLTPSTISSRRRVQDSVISVSIDLMASLAPYNLQLPVLVTCHLIIYRASRGQFHPNQKPHGILATLPFLTASMTAGQAFSWPFFNVLCLVQKWKHLLKATVALSFPHSVSSAARHLPLHLCRTTDVCKFLYYRELYALFSQHPFPIVSPVPQAPWTLSLQLSCLLL